MALADRFYSNGYEQEFEVELLDKDARKTVELSVPLLTVDQNVFGEYTKTGDGIALSGTPVVA